MFKGREQLDVAAVSLEALVDQGVPPSAKKIFADEHPVASREWPTASTAGYLAIFGFRPSFGFDEVIKRVAMRAV